MKRILLFFILIFNSFIIYAEILSDISDDRKRVIETTPVCFATNYDNPKDDYYMSLGYEELYFRNDTISYYYIKTYIYSDKPRIVPEDSYMLIKTGFDKTVELTSLEELDLLECEPENFNGDIVWKVPVRYLITGNYIDQVWQDDVKKIRLEIPWNKGYFDIDNSWMRFSFRVEIADLKLQIDKHLRNHHSIYDNW